MRNAALLKSAVPRVKEQINTLTLLLLPLLATLVFAGGHGGKKTHEMVEIPDGDYVSISGTIQDSHKEPVGEA